MRIFEPRYHGCYEDEGFLRHALSNFDCLENIMDFTEISPATTATAIAREIDQQVYSLYTLTPEEIKIAEEAGQ